MTLNFLLGQAGRQYEITSSAETPGSFATTQFTTRSHQLSFGMSAATTLAIRGNGPMVRETSSGDTLMPHVRMTLFLRPVIE